jgi:ElaB/YqjD/DUF883 family membrane-anchored ribosome-binding protein
MERQTSVANCRDDEWSMGRSMEMHSAGVTRPGTDPARDLLLLDLRSLARDAERLIAVTGDDANTAAPQARERLQGVIEHIKATCKALNHRAVAANVTTPSVQRLRGSSYRSIGVAFGLGMLFGWLLRRK